MITKLIALLTLLFAPMHISNNLLKDGAVERDKVSLSRPLLNNSLELKQARDYNEYYGNNSLNTINRNVSSTFRDVTITTNNNNTFTYSGTYNLKTQTPPKIYISQISYKSQNNSFFYVSAKHLSGTCSNAVKLSVSFWYTQPNGGRNKINALLTESNGNFNYFIDLNTIGYDINIDYITLNPKEGTYNDYTFGIYVFCPSNLDTFVPYGDIYTGVQVDDDFDEYPYAQNKQSYPLYGSKVTYVDNDETYVHNNLQPTSLNSLTYEQLYNIIEPSNETWNNTCTLTFDFNSSISAGDLLLYSFMFNKIQIYQSNGQLFYEYDYGYNTTGSFDLSSLSLNDTQKNQYINKVVLTFTNSSYRPTMQKILLRAENKINSFSYDYGYDKGLKEGETIGYNNGLEVGDEQGYNRGYNDGRSEGEANTNYNAFTLISNAFSSFGKLLNVEIYNGLTIGVIVCVPIIFSVVLFIIKMIKG